MATVDEILSRQTYAEDGTWTDDTSYPSYKLYTDPGYVQVTNKRIENFNDQVSVRGETNAQFIGFELPRYDDGIDLTQQQMHIHYETASGGGESAPCNVSKSDSHVRICWKIPAQATQRAEAIQMMIYAIGTNSEGESITWKTLPAYYTINDSLDIGGDIPEPDLGWYEQFVWQMDNKVSEAKTYADNAEVSKTAAEAAANRAETVETGISEQTEEAKQEIDRYVTEKEGELKGPQGEPGADGISPTVDISKTGKVTTIIITDASGEHTATINDGADGSGGTGTAADPLESKKIVCIGDSICEGVGANERPYPYWIQQWHPDSNVINLGVGGMTVAQKSADITNAMPVRILSGEFEADCADADIIVLEGGINDLMNNVRLGCIRAGSDAAKYDTYCAGMEYMLSYFKGLAPMARIIFLSTHYVTPYDHNKSAGWWAAASEICAKWGVEFLDLFHLIRSDKVSGLQLHPDANTHRDYYARYLNNALIASAPLAGAATSNYYALNVPLMLVYYSGTIIFQAGETVSTSDWRINMVRADLTTYVNVTNSVQYDLSDVDNTQAGVYPIHVTYTEGGITLSLDKDITISGEAGERTLSDITATKTITSYQVGDTVGTDDITVTAQYSDGTTADVTSAAQIDTSNANMSTAGDYSIFVSYTEGDITKTTTISISVSESGGGTGATTVATGTFRNVANQEAGTWELDSDGIIRLRRTGTENTDIASYADGQQPWYDYMSQIKEVIFESGLINTGNSSFTTAPALKKVTLADTVKEISAMSFMGCAALETINSENVEKINGQGLRNCTALTTITVGACELSLMALYNCSALQTLTFTGTSPGINNNALQWCSVLTDIYVPWADGAVDGAPWGATAATIHYNTTV